ncbi:MAG: 4Fe-4S binding protein [Armatimonadota bacterium]|nr:4Fe-4S binding protein [Armatimonadota bacterium]MDR5697551.1 4Fe-4S binding protein [Armatimonadota bacterium]
MAGSVTWRQLDRGPVIPGGTSRGFSTGDWRQEAPILDLDRCVHCMLCWLYCPDSSILVAGGRVVGIDYEHCKGCGICAAVCPPRASAIRMEAEGA